jgi:hypothetical protein
MKYFVFDMDEAIAELYSVFYCITSLRLKDTIREDHLRLLPLLSDSLEKQVDKAYRLFVKKVLREELSSKPLGILRPGVLHVMNSLHRLQRAKKVAHVVIYSNNGTLTCLEFIRDLIHENIGSSTLIGECVHRTHPLRTEEQTAKNGLNDRYEKTWSSLRKVLIEGKCRAPSTLSVNDVYFFDDLDHKDLHRAIGNHYYQVPPYEFKASFERLSEIYRMAVEEANVNMYQFAPLITMMYGTFSSDPFALSIQRIIQIFQASTERTAKRDDIPLPYQRDKGITMMKDAIHRVQCRMIHRVQCRTIRKKTHKRYHKKDT